MPEYLSPGVYMEEFEIGAKPIEGVSTSTAGFVGVAERGPLNKPTLVTSMGEYVQIFGGYLDKKVYEKTFFLPYAVENFFSNGGKRVYITRVADSKVAKSAAGFVPDVSGGVTSLQDIANAKSMTIKVKDISKLALNDILLLKDKDQSEYVKYISKAKNIILTSGLQNNYPNGISVDKMELGVDLTCKTAAKITKGDTTITLNNTTNLVDGQVVYIDDANNSEICYIDTVDAGNKSIKLKTTLINDHASGIPFKNFKAVTPSVSTPLLAGAKAGVDTVSIISTDTDFNKDNFIRLNSKEYFVIKDVDTDINIVLLEQELKYKHESNTDVVQLIPSIEITALNEGSWGNKLKITTKATSISSQIKVIDPVSNSNTIKVNTIAGVEKGTVLKIAAAQYVTVKEVLRTDTENKIIATSVIVNIAKDTIISTAEFDLIVSFENNPVEVFKNLSLNSDHSRFVEKIITNKTSHFIIAKQKTGASIPMPTQDKAPGWVLDGGKDGVPTTDVDINSVYEGVDAVEPDDRTGLYTLQNIDDISIVAIPGITTQYMQNKLINHCELMKDRFAILDSVQLADLKEIQEQRNYYDSDYAALYYPWISVFDPVTKDNINVPPSGSICGIYARSDIERGVHKAPANEVVSLALDLENLGNSHRIITTGQQDILNPKGINCIRVFPGRGIRVWGARTLSSDPLWKYINVRRLFLYIEESIDQGTQWVVFEPNDIPLWARVKQTITQFLTDVWRSGALAGATPEEAFFVKCDRTTMSQGDIDNGRLICVIGVAPVKPAEFVIFRIAQWTGGAK